MVAVSLEQQARYPSPPGRGSAGGDAVRDQRPEMTTTKPGALAPGVCLLSRGAFPRGSGAAVRGLFSGNSRAWKQPDRFQIRWFSVVGRSCRRWHLGPGVEWDVPLGPGHLRRCSGRRVSPPGKTTPGTSVIRREVLEQGPDRQRAPRCCSGGVFHQWSLRIPLQPRWSRQRVPARAAALPTLLFTGGNGAS